MKEIQIGVELVGSICQRGGIGADPDGEHIFNIGGSSYEPGRTAPRFDIYKPDSEGITVLNDEYVSHPANATCS